MIFISFKTKVFAISRANKSKCHLCKSLLPVNCPLYKLLSASEA